MCTKSPATDRSGDTLSLKQKKIYCSESHGSNRDEYRNEASFHRPMSKQKSESSDEARPVTTRSTTLTNERSRSGSRAQPTTLYNEAANALRHGLSTKRLESQHLQKRLIT
ncbi:hypothetical protein FHG87_014229 [Trinorchestia longiramus]|nr:hypothetical protein FHG87_014229 [Trinorchestia longiramus]